jgi:cell shape-determining protein MreC
MMKGHDQSSSILECLWRLVMNRGQSGARRPATKFAHLQKKLDKLNVQKNLNRQLPRSPSRQEPPSRPRRSQGG